MKSLAIIVLLLSAYNLLALIGNWGVIVWLPSLLKDTGISITTVGSSSTVTDILVAANHHAIAVAFTSSVTQEDLLSGLLMAISGRIGAHLFLQLAMMN